MTNPCLLVNYFVSHFSNNSSFSDVSFVVGYTDQVKNSPLPDPTVSVGVDGYTDQRCSPVYDDDDVLLYNRLSKTRIAFNIYVPVKTKGISALDIFYRLSDKLMSNDLSFSVKGVGCDEIKFVRDEGALLLKSWADIEEFCIDEETSS